MGFWFNIFGDYVVGTRKVNCKVPPKALQEARALVPEFSDTIEAIIGFKKSGAREIACPYFGSVNFSGGNKEYGCLPSQVLIPTLDLTITSNQAQPVLVNGIHGCPCGYYKK